MYIERWTSGLHLRFRLGGECFPPRLLYKIFTHRPVTDICSFCPRDYNAASLARGDDELDAYEAARKQSAVFSVTVIGDSGLPEAPAGWYQREENNHWRPVDGKLFMLGGMSSPKPLPIFHFSSRVRMKQRELKRKKLHREWRLAMYRCECRLPRRRGP
jgi:hypothetical protein